MLKLFVLVRDDLTPPQRAVQACHAVAEFMLRNGHKPLVKEWAENEKTIVLIGTDNEHELVLQLVKIQGHKFEHATFNEPDMNNELTSIAVLLMNSGPLRKLGLEESV